MRDPDATTRRHAMRSVPEAAREVGVPQATLQSWIESGELLAVRLGRSPMVDLGEVGAVRDRLLGQPKRRRSGWPQRTGQAIGLGDVIVGAIGLVAFGAGPADLRSPLALFLSLLCLAVGVLLLGDAGLPDLARRKRAPEATKS